MDWVAIGNPGNLADTATNCFATDCGSVADPYLISRYEVTNAQYVEFLNLKAAADPLGLYSTGMNSSAQGGITRSGSSGSYTYTVKPGFADKPVNFVTFYDALRFTNWLNNGQGSAATETGAYTSRRPASRTTRSRNAGAEICMPTENEWYKAALQALATSSIRLVPTQRSTVTCRRRRPTPRTVSRPSTRRRT
jgi:formylglycine-generating enzyme required for sulfatase activity